MWLSSTNDSTNATEGNAMTAATDASAAEAFKQWCIVELFGHRRYAGLVSEATFPPGFVRLDVPEDGARKATTHFYAPAAIYGLHPVDEARAHGHSGTKWSATACNVLCPMRQAG